MKNLKQVLKQVEKEWKNRTALFLCDIENHINLEEVETLDDLTELLQDTQFFDAEVIYYSNAIKYLQENDQSLQTSLELAEDLGYKINDINSELLASLLQTEANKDDWQDIIKEIEEAIED